MKPPNLELEREILRNVAKRPLKERDRFIDALVFHYRSEIDKLALEQAQQRKVS